LQAASDKITPTFQTVNTTLKSRIGSLRNSSYFKTFENTLGSTVNAVKTKITPSKSAMNFGANEDDELQSGSGGGVGGSMSTSATHDDHLNFGGSPDSKKNPANK